MKRILAILFLLLPITAFGQAEVIPRPIKGENMTITRSLSLLVTNEAIEVATVTEDYRVAYIAPALAKVCDVPRLERNLIAAAKGSERAVRYINKCLSKMPKEPHSVFLPYPSAECAGQYLQADSQGRLQWVPPCKEIK